MNEHKHITQTKMCDEDNFNTGNLIFATYIEYNNFKYIRDIIQQHKIRNKINITDHGLVKLISWSGSSSRALISSLNMTNEASNLISLLVLY